MDIPNDPGHGDSPAAWTAVIIMLIGIAAGSVFFFLHQPIMVWICAGVVLLGLIAGWVLAKAGWGVN
ncbi:HGxxPAAW family protein, partial [Paraburkholderia sp. EG304]|uniref:HGxxPAAW family protein n=1 Tax=Paraburkholderia sp. EG304 TaxID=3237015 RepID=UPI00397DB07D